MAPKSKARDLLEFLVLFALLYFLTQFALQRFFPEQFGGKNGTERSGIVLTMQDATVKGGHHPVAYLANYTQEPLVLPDRCPQPPLDVAYRGDGEENFAVLTATGTVLPCTALSSVEPGDRATVDLSPWKYALFDAVGEYRLSLPEGVSSSGAVVTTFTMHQAGSATVAFRAFVTKPLLNLLIFVASWMPGYNLGLAIILLTFIVKIVLFVPTQHGLHGQRKLQAVQPKLDAIKKKYTGNPQKIQEETLKIWKEYKINPFQSCLPILIQFPILIGLFYVIRDGSVLALSRHLIYPFYDNLSWSFGTQFLGLDLLSPNKIVLPPLLVILQFLQMKLSFAIAKRKKARKKEETPEAAEEKTPQASAQQMQQKMMLYGLPIMIGFFALQFPAAVSLYWGVSTLFAIGQQVVVNRKELV